MKYRPEIDGLRAIAVVSVILSHANFAVFEGGFIGVDVFFVISGYLITSIILDEYVRGDFSLARFYERRAKRILPALFFVLVSCAIMAWFWLLPGAYEAFSKSLMLAALSVSNFYFLKKNDYFAPDAAEVPLLHTWSLGVEEQFYMLFPLLFLFRLKLRTIFTVVAVLAIASLVASEIGAWRFPSANYYLLPTRAWEIPAGSLCAFYVFGKPRRTSGILASLGLVLIISAIFAFEPETRVPSIAALLPVGGAALFLLFSSGESYAGRLLSWTPLVWIGRISFSAYLWHQPVFSFWRIRNLEPPSMAVMWGLIPLVFILAATSWHLVEQPFRHTQATIRKVATTVTACLVIFVGFGAWGALDGLSFRLDPEVKNFMEATTWSGKCLFQTTDGMPSLPADKCMFNVGADKTYAVWGDSISAAIAPALLEELQQDDVGLVQLTHGFCAPIIGVWNARHERAANCDLFNRRAMDYLLASNVEVVVLAASWANFFNAKYMYIDGLEFQGSDITVPALAKNLKATMETLEEAGKRVVVVYPTPRFNKAIAEAMAATIIKGDATPDFAYPYSAFKADTARSYSVLDAAISGDPIEKVLPEAIFCAPIDSGLCYFGRDGVAYIADKSHYTHKGAEMVADHIMAELATDEIEAESAAIMP